MSGAPADEITIDVTFPAGLAPSPLEKSIAHWRRMRDAETVAELFGEAPYGDDCALCQAHRNPAAAWDLECAGCPVSVRAGRALCQSTPYGAAASAFGSWRDTELGRARFLDARDRWRTAADAEIAFLESLREPAP